MFTGERPSHLLLVTMVLALGDCARAAVSNDAPRFRLPNGTTLENRAELAYQRGAPIELYCTGQAQDLEIYEIFHREDVLTMIYVVNQTSVRSVTELAPYGSYYYQCVDRETHETASVSVTVNSLPVVTNFKCISENLEFVKCEWRSDNVHVLKASFDYVENGVSFRLCKWEDIYFYGQYGYNCIWTESHAAVAFQKDVSDNITFSVNACVQLGCTNQTFEVQLKAIQKMEAPRLEIEDITSHSVTLRWISHLRQRDLFNQRFSSDYGNFKIVCVQSGILEFEVNHTGLFNDWNYFELQLPCADTFYEVQVSVKPTEAVGSEYWSEPATVSFTSEEAADPALDAADPTCAHTRVALSPHVMLAYADMFRTKITEELRALREKILSMKLKANGIIKRNEGN